MYAGHTFRREEDVASSKVKQSTAAISSWAQEAQPYFGREESEEKEKECYK